MNTITPAQQIHLLTKKYAQPNTARSVYEYFITWCMLFINSYLLWKVISIHSLLITPLIVLQAFIIVRIFILQHDCGHKSLFKKQSTNNIAGFICSLVTSIPYHFWRLTHATHHQENSDLDKRPWSGAITILTVEEFNLLSPMQKKAYAIKRNFYVLMFVGWLYHLYTHHISLTSDNKKFATRKILTQINITNLTQIALFALVIFFISLKYFLLAIALPTILALSIGVFLFCIQHNFENSFFYTKEEEQSHGSSLFIKSSLEGSSCLLLPGILRWFTGNIGYHHIHHISIKIPFYNLKKVHDENTELRTAYVITLKNALKQFSYKLYDVNTRKMLTWRDYKKIYVNSYDDTAAA